ncbi:manganese efflux pump MntP [Desulfothermobacter acidiphilus]|uniref:manganese efflux pump MntP n=1 Tax=Desulfothermobacter acidiphilus TaxID=1938353 RepID=UPI003F8A9A83
MEWLTLFLLAVVLGTDAFSVAVGLGLGALLSRRRALGLIFTVAAYHVFMPLAGWWTGKLVELFLGSLAALLGAAVLLYLGARLLWSHFRRGEGEAPALRPGLGGILLLGASVSLDALSVGFSLGVYHFPPLLVALVCGAVAGFMTALGLGLGRLAGVLVGRWAQLAGGILLIGIGLHFLRGVR